MNGTFATCLQAILAGTTSATSSPGSADGPWPFDWRGGPRTAPCGPDPVPASRSARQAEALGLLTSGTCGQHSTTLSASAALQQPLESKLTTLVIGSILYRLTWKHKATPSGRRFCLLRASAARISDPAVTGWLTARMEDGESSGARWSRGTFDTLTAVATHLAGWPTTSDANGSGTHGTGGLDLRTTALLAGPIRLCSDGTLLTGSSAEMAAGGRLDPAFSRWLMRLPPAWDACAPSETPLMLKRRRSSPAR